MALSLRLLISKYNSALGTPGFFKDDRSMSSVRLYFSQRIINAVSADTRSDEPVENVYETPVVPGYRARGPGSIPGATKLSEK
jgi:hypothetical protein